MKPLRPLSLIVVSVIVAACGGHTAPPPMTPAQSAAYRPMAASPQIRVPDATSLADGFAYMNLKVQQSSSGFLYLQGGGDGLLWFSDDYDNLIGSIDPATRAVAKHAIPQSNGFFGGPVSLTGTSTGVAVLLYYGFATAANTTVNSYYTGSPSAGGKPLSDNGNGLAAMSDGSVYFVASDPITSGNTLYHAMPTSSPAAPITPPSTNAALNFPTLGSDGNIYFIDTLANVAGRYNTTTKTIDNYAMKMPAGARVQSMVAGPQSQVWACGSASGETVWAKVNTATPALSEILDLLSTSSSCPADSNLATVGSDGALWFAEYSSLLMRISGTTHQYSTYDSNVAGVPNGGSGIESVAAASDHNIWFYMKFNQVALFKRHTISSSPATISVAKNSSTTVSVSELQYSGSFNVDPAATCASKVSVSTLSSTSFSIHGNTLGSCFLGIEDANGMARVYVKIRVT